MNLSRVESFAIEAQTIVQEADKLSAEIDKLNGYQRLADNLKEREQELQIVNARKDMQSKLDGVTQVALDRIGASDLDGARTKVTDAIVRIQNAKKAFQTYRATLAELEFVAAKGGFAESEDKGMTRAQADQQVDQARSDYELRVTQAAECVPNRPLILLK